MMVRMNLEERTGRNTRRYDKISQSENIVICTVQKNIWLVYSQVIFDLGKHVKLQQEEIIEGIWHRGEVLHFLKYGCMCEYDA